MKVKVKNISHYRHFLHKYGNNDIDNREYNAMIITENDKVCAPYLPASRSSKSILLITVVYVEELELKDRASF